MKFNNVGGDLGLGAAERKGSGQHAAGEIVEKIAAGNPGVGEMPCYAPLLRGIIAPRVSDILRLPGRMKLLPLCLLVLALPFAAKAQDAFEIQTYEWETVPKGMWNLETHLNYIGKGTKAFEGTVAPTNNQFHMTYELTHGITPNFEMAGYLVTARRVGGGLDYVGARIRPRFSLPESWLPFKFSLSTEVGFPRKIYEENSVTFELRPIIEKNFGRLQFDVNPTLGRALRGPGTKDGWDFEPCVRVAYKVNKRFEPSVEYYGGTGPFFDPLPRHEQVHQFYPGADIQINENLVWNVGFGLAATSEGSQFVYKMRIGWLFGHKAN